MRMSRWMAGGAVLAGAAWWNQHARAAAGPLRNPIGGAEIEYRWRGHRIAGTVRGDGPPVLLVHSIHAAAWSWEWRHTADALGRSRRVYTYDLLGFGLSDRPDVEYSAELYVDLMSDFAREMVCEPCALIANSLSAAHALIAAARAPEQFPALVVVQPTGMTLLVEGNAAASAIQQVVRAPLAGAALFDALVSRPSIRYFLGKSYLDTGRVTDDVVDDHYRAAHQAGARFAPAAFVGFRLNADARDAARRITQPTLMVWGSHPHSNPLTERDAYLRARPDWESLTVENAGDMPHDEQPSVFNATVEEFLQRTPMRVG
jgi:pimeloyl-ACP methyl ester carboxylesterase